MALRNRSERQKNVNQDEVKHMKNEYEHEFEKWIHKQHMEATQQEAHRINTQKQFECDCSMSMSINTNMHLHNHKLGNYHN